MSSEILAKCSEIYEESVSPRSVAEYYLSCELDNILSDGHTRNKSELKKTIESFDDLKIWRLTEALAFTFRTNHIFQLITDQGRDWYEVELPVDQIAIGGVNPKVNRVTFSEEIDRSPVKFGDYLKDYFEKFQEKDPKGLAEFKPNLPISYPTIIVGEKGGKIVTYDGIHRLMAQVLSEKNSVRAYLAINNGKSSKSIVGDSIFLQLRMLYQAEENDENKKHILECAMLLAKFSLTGKGSVDDYWASNTHPSKTEV